MSRWRPDGPPRRPLHQTLGGQAYLLTLALVFLWLLELVDMVIFEGTLDRLGITPRDPRRLLGILCAPFLHEDFGHLAANSIPLTLLGWLVLLRGLRDCLWVVLGSILASGALVWTFGAAGTVHIGASGLIFGFLGFLLSRALVEHSVVNLLVALVVAFLYGSLLWGVFPSERGVSWEGHLGGLLGGAALALLLPVRTRLNSTCAEHRTETQRRGT